jgi:uncharacterized protein YndB with AHSA1/START domain
MPDGPPADFHHRLTIAAPPARVLHAFFDPAALAEWWLVTRAITTPRPLGIYAIEWGVTESRDEVLGALGGIFYGIVMEFVADREFLVAGAYWLPPEGDPVGPMALEVKCKPDPIGTELQVRQTGYEGSLRWSRYYAVITPGWITSLNALKRYVERQSAEPGS